MYQHRVNKRSAQLLAEVIELNADQHMGLTADGTEWSITHKNYFNKGWINNIANSSVEELIAIIDLAIMSQHTDDKCFALEQIEHIFINSNQLDKLNALREWAETEFDHAQGNLAL